MILSKIGLVLILYITKKQLRPMPLVFLNKLFCPTFHNIHSCNELSELDNLYRAVIHSHIKVFHLYSIPVNHHSSVDNFHEYDHLAWENPFFASKLICFL